MMAAATPPIQENSMEPAFTDEELSAERERLQKMVALCDCQGEADGKNAALAQLRAVNAEVADRRD
jgi:hypothetical protein